MIKQGDKQKLLIEYLLSSVDTFALCKNIVRADYFDPEYRRTVEFINTYYDEYSAVPNAQQVYAETGMVTEHHILTHDQVRYTADEIEKFCRRRALEKVIWAAPDIIAQGDYGKVESQVKEALSISLQKDLGLEYFKDPLERLELLATQPLRTPTGFGPIDELLGGGIARTEILLFCANSGGGKSITLANLAYNFVHQGKRVLYLSLELSQDLVAQRFDIMFTGIPSFMVQKEYKTIAYKLNEASKGLGRLDIRWMHSNTSSNAIRSYLKEYELQTGFIPDLLIVDYLDIMGTNEHVPAGEIWEKDKRATEQLRDIGFDYNLFIATASQLNRAAIDAPELHQGHTAGGISKVNTVDWQWAIIQTPAMKAQGEIMFQCLKSRSSDAVGSAVYMTWDNKYLRIITKKEEGDDSDVDKLGQAINERKTSKGLPDKSKRSILDIMDNE